MREQDPNLFRRERSRRRNREEVDDATASKSVEHFLSSDREHVHFDRRRQARTALDLLDGPSRKGQNLPQT